MRNPNIYFLDIKGLDLQKHKKKWRIITGIYCIKLLLILS